MSAFAAALPAFLARNPLPFEFAFLLLFGFCLPISEEIALALVGATFKAAGSPLWAAVPVALAALLVQDNAFFFLARVLGSRLFKIRLLSRLFRSRAVEGGRRYLELRGPAVVFTSRFVVGLRSAVILGSGFLGLAWRRFALFDALAASISTPAWLYLGYALGSQIEAGAGVSRLLGLAGPAAVVAIAVAVFLGVRADRARADAEARAAGRSPAHRRARSGEAA